MRSGIFIILLVAIGIMACEPSGTADSGKLKIVATTGMIGDAVAVIAGDKAEVSTLMGPGVDPHLYKATQGDLSTLRAADLVFYNGLHLEGKMQEIFDRLSEDKPVFAVSDAVPDSLLRVTSSSGTSVTHDPHLWFDVQLWMRCVALIGQKLQEQDAEHAEYYAARTAAYLEELRALDDTVRTLIASIPEANRILITSHDAFGYFGKTYGIQVKGLQGISTAAEFGLKDITDMVDLIITDSIKAVFVESSVSEKSIQAVMEGCAQKGHPIKQGGVLYSDAMGAKGTAEGTYLGMVKHNAIVISEALR